MSKVILALGFLVISPLLLGQGKLNNESVVKPSKPRIVLRPQSHGTDWNLSHDQSMEMSKDFQDVCPNVQVSLSQSLSDYIVEWNHREHGFVRDNQMQIANRQGDVFRVKGSGSIKGTVKKACAMILADWAKR